MEVPEAGPADGEERIVELRPRTRSNPEGAEDRRSSNNNNAISVGSRSEGEGEAAITDSPTPSTSSAVPSKDRPKPAGPPVAPLPVAPTTEFHLRAPRVNCPEKVIICLDLSEEMSLQKLESFNGSKTNALNISQKMIEMFVRTKHKIDKRHEFALVVVNDDALWLSGFTSDPRELCSCLYDLETNICESFNFEDLLNLIGGTISFSENCRDVLAAFRAVQYNYALEENALFNIMDPEHGSSSNCLQKIELPQMDNVQTIPPPYVIRTLLIYSRHTGQPQFSLSEGVSKMLQSPYFFFDIIYLHNGVDEQVDESSSKDVYTVFCNLDSKGMCYRFEVSLCGPAIELHNCMAKLLSHPLQRPFQSHASYSLLEGEETQEIEATV